MRTQYTQYAVLECISPTFSFSLASFHISPLSPFPATSLHRLGLGSTRLSPLVRMHTILISLFGLAYHTRLCSTLDFYFVSGFVYLYGCSTFALVILNQSYI